MEALSPLRDLEDRLALEFRERRHVLSYDEFFAAFLAEPRRHLRSAPQYLRDCMAHYGTREIVRAGQRFVRFNLFDCPWSGGKDRIVGQEEAQGAIFRLLQNFVRERRVTRLVMLHGPNGSAKSSLIECLGQALEHYSTLDEGAIYRFNWVFPSMRVSKKRLGFSGNGAPHEVREALASFAHLEDEDVDARLPADLRDHPLLLLPVRERKALLTRLIEEGKLPQVRGEEPLPEYLLEGDLSPRSRAIADALVNAYHGDLQRVFQHVQVCRFNFSRRYRQGVVTIEPQIHVDAGMRQVTMDQGIHSLPPSLRSLNLYEPFGDLVDANRGLVNYNDLLKKPIEAFKYLLATCERGTVALPNAILHLDVLFFASSNEIHLRAFKEHPDFASFKGRMDLVRMPYLRDYKTERVIYDEHLAAGALDDQVVPHATFVLALWAVLTRLKRPRAELHGTRVRDVIAKLSPMEKAELYANLRLPRELTPEQARELLAAVPEVLAEGQDMPDSEGLSGASPREMKQVLLNALQSKRHWGLSPLGIVEELREHVKMRSVYEYLQAKRDGGYHDHEGFIDQVFDRWLDLVDGELRHAMGMVDEQRYEDLFAKYLLNVTYLQKGEKLYNDRTGNYDPPDAKLIGELERTWELNSDPERFRRDLVSRVGAWRVENRGEPIPWRRLFPKLIEALESDYYGKQKQRVHRQLEHCMTVLAAETLSEDATTQGLSSADVAKTKEVLERLQRDHGHPKPSLRETLGALLKARY